MVPSPGLLFVELGNPRPADPRVPGPTITEISDVPAEIMYGADGKALGERFPVRERIVHEKAAGHRAFLTVLAAWHHGGTAVVQGGGRPHGVEDPSWVRVVPMGGSESVPGCPEAAGDLERQLAEHWGCPQGHPEDLEATHYTRNGPPGVGA